MKPSPIPSGYHSVNPVLIVEGARQLVEFLQQVFGAEQRSVMEGPGGAIAHAEVQIGDSVIMISDASPQFQARKSAIYVYLPEVDTVYQKAITAGATSRMEPADMFWGDRCGGFEDHFGNYWSVATHVEDVSDEEMAKRSADYFEKASAK
jgi:PhnB protein